MISRESPNRKIAKQRLLESGWSKSDILEEASFSRSGNVFRVDILLLYNLFPIAVIEVNSFAVSLDDATRQIGPFLEFVEAPFTFVISPDEIMEIQTTAYGGFKRYSKFPSPSELLDKLDIDANNNPLLVSPIQLGDIKPSAHHIMAIKRALEAIQTGKKRILISMAPGTGKTYVAIQIAWKLIEAQIVSRVLFLTSRVERVKQIRQIIDKAGWSANIIDESSSNLVETVSISTFSRYFKIDIEESKFDLVILDDANPMVNISNIGQHFNHVTVLGFTHHGSPNRKLSKLFGGIAFVFSIEDAIATSEINPPNGFIQVQLGDIAEIRTGIHVTKDQIRPPDYDNLVKVVKGRNVLPDGTIDYENLERIKTSDEKKYFVKDGRLRDDYCLKRNDILILSLTSAGYRNVAFLDFDPYTPTTFSSSLIRIRVDPEFANPRDVYLFLRSDNGQKILRRFTIQGSTIPRITLHTLKQIAVFLPEHKSDQNIVQELSSVASALNQLKKEILPLLNKAEKASLAPDGDNEEDLEFIAEKLHRIAISLTPPKFPEIVLNTFPTPIALAYRRYHDARFNVYERILRLRDVFEASSFFIYNVFLADSMRRLDPIKFFISDKGVRAAYNGYSMSTRIAFVREIIEIERQENTKMLFLSELVNTSFVDYAIQLQYELRNPFSQTGTGSESQIRNKLETFAPIVDDLLNELGFLSEYRMARITSYYYHRRSFYQQMELYRGVVPEIDQQPLSENSEFTEADKDHLVLLDREDQFLDLFPLYQLLANEDTRYDTHLCYFKQRKAQSKELEGESSHGAFPVSLLGFETFENLMSGLLSEPPEE